LLIFLKNDKRLGYRAKSEITGRIMNNIALDFGVKVPKKQIIPGI